MQHPKFGRKSLGMTRYVAVLDEIQSRLQQQGQSLGVVYLSSHLPAASFISAEHMTKTYPRPFRYSVLPRLDTGKEETEIKVFKAVSSGDLASIPPLREMYIEYLADIYTMMEADIYIGAYSNVYALAGSMVSFLIDYPDLSR